MNKGRIWIALFLWLVCFASADWVQAQEPLDNETQQLGEPQNADEVTNYDLTWLDLLYGERTLTLADKDSTFDIYLPLDVVSAEAGNYVDFVFSHNMLDAERQGGLEVSLNDAFLQFIFLTAENANRGRVQLDLPGNLLQPGRNRLRLKMNAGSSCGGTLTVTPIVVIHNDSLLHLEYTEPLRQPDLGLYPLPFYERTFLPSQIYFVLPEKPTVADISTAATISAGLGIYSNGGIRVASVLPSEVTDDIKQNNHLITIGQQNTNPLLAELDLPLPLSNPIIKNNSGVLQTVVSPWNPRKAILVVTGHTNEGVMKAGDVLNRDLNFLGMRGPIAVIDEVLPPPQTAALREIDLTFDALGYEDASFFGTRPQEARVEFFMPRSWQMVEQAKLFLSFNHSSVIDPEKSTLSIELNQVPVSGTLLNTENAVNGFLEVELPRWLLQPNRNRIEAKIGMIMSADPCQDVDNAQAWTVIRRDSFIHLPYLEQETSFDLSFFPVPFNNNPNLIDVSLVLPETLNRPERDRLLQLAVLLGQQAGGDRLTLRIVNSQDIDDTMRKTKHFITFGRPTNNAFLREINNVLPQPFQTDADELAPRLDSAILIETTRRSAGLIQELVSPWNANKTILALTGTTDEGVIAAFDLLLGNLPEEVLDNVDLAGDLAVIEDEYTHSIDTRLLTAVPVPERSTLVQPVIQTNVLPQRELANYWW